MESQFKITRTPILAAMLGAAMVAMPSPAQDAKMPAARAHVKQVGANYVKFTSKLSHVVELNFTMGNGHRPGKAIISESLDRIAQSYAVNGKPAFSIKKFTGKDGGSAKNDIPDFTVEDLLQAQAIVANNVSMFGTSSLGSQKQQAIQRAIEVEGIGYLGFHGSGDNTQSGWPWYTNTLHPMNYDNHGARVEAPIYKHPDKAKHVMLEGILESNTEMREVPNELSESGAEVYANLPVREMKNEWYRFGRDISRDPKYQDKVTILLKYDPRELSQGVLSDQYRRNGGNLYTYTYQVGKGMTSYIPAGHENDELLDPNTGFDGGTGDFDRYVAQTLFYLAGYTAGICDASCNGLPIVDAENRLTGQVYEGSTAVKALNPARLHFEPGMLAFSTRHEGRYEAVVSDLSGRVLFRKSGMGPHYHAFNQSELKPGVYFLSVRLGKSAPEIRRYALTAASVR